MRERNRGKKLAVYNKTDHSFIKLKLLSGIVYTLSQKGKPQIRIGEYTFFIHFTRKMKTRWACSTHQTKGCKANIYTMDDKILKINNSHNHSIY